METRLIKNIIKWHPYRILLLEGDTVVDASSALLKELAAKGLKSPVGESIYDLSWMMLSDEAKRALERPAAALSPISWQCPVEIPGLAMAQNVLCCIDTRGVGTFMLCISDKTADWVVARVPEVIAVSSGYSPGRFSFISAGIETWTGIQADRFIKDHGLFFRMIHPEDHDRIEKAFKDLGNTGMGQTLALSLRLVHSQGGFRWIKLKGTCIEEEPGHPLHLFTMVDVTEETERELELKQSVQRYALLHEHGPLGIMCIDRTGRVVDCNKRLAEMAGIEVEDLLGQNVLSYSNPMLREITKSVLRGKEVNYKGSYTTAITNKELFISIKAFPLRTEDGLIVGGYVFVEDISQTAEIEKRLDAEKRFNQAVVESAGIIVAAVDRFGFIRKTNSVLNELAGVKDDKALKGRLFWEVMVSEQEQNRFVEAMKECIRDRISFQLETRLKTNGDPEAGEDRLISWRISPLDEEHQAGRETDTYLITGTDVTALKRLEDQFRASQKMEAIGRLAGGIAHDFNNQLTAILGYCQMMQMDSQEDSRLNRQLDVIVKAAKRAAETTNQLLAFSRKQMLQPKKVSMNKVVLDSTVLFERLIGEAIEIRYELSPSDAVVEIDPGQFQQVLLNLALNARDAMKEGGTLIIRTAVKSFVAVPGNEFGGSGTYACIDFQDTGVGMSKEVQEKAFEPFFTTKPVGQGTGLGLSMVYGTIKQSGGYVFIDSRQGEGTTVHILLPVVEGEVPPLEGEVVLEETSVLHGGGRTVMVVEDEMLVLHLVNNFLEKLGFEVKSFADPIQALAYLEACGPDETPELLLTDLVLPRMNGKDMADKALEMVPGLKVLYMSGYSAEMISKHGILPGDTTFLQKPFTLAQFSQKLRQILEGQEE